MNVWPDRSEIFLDERTDGRKKYNLDAIGRRPGTVEKVTISNSGPADGQATVMFDPLFALTPFGRPLHSFVGDSCRIEADGDIVRLVTSTNKGVMTFDLDPRHDWLARRVALGDAFEMNVDEFKLDNGRWFPSEGQSRTVEEGSPRREQFTVTAFRINRPIEDDRFKVDLAHLPRGVTVVDRATTQGYIVGGIPALRDLDKQGPTAASRAEEPAGGGALPEAGPPPGGHLVSALAVVTTVSFLVAAALIARRWRKVAKP